MNISLDYPSLSDRRLVELHLSGDRSAFRQIVERYQAMVCALGLSACGDIGRSEDLAQEVFVAAWKQLPALREPEKLRGWLAGIARNLGHNSFRRQQRTPTAQAEPLSVETPSEADSPQQKAISAEEAGLMWNALEGIPENYREPMVLYYREHQSVSGGGGRAGDFRGRRAPEARSRPRAAERAHGQSWWRSRSRAALRPRRLQAQ